MKAADYHRLAIDTAKKSPCQKRKVGAVLTSGAAFATGYNHNNGKACELADGTTDTNTVHAEIAAAEAFDAKYAHTKLTAPLVMYVTQPPCADCADELTRLGIHVVLVEEFMKFDSNKLRYELIPPSATHALAEVLTYGARKYKPENWRKGEQKRYIGAAMRHLEAWRDGEACDKESGLPHLAHLLTNVAFLIELDKAEPKSERTE